MKQMEMLIEDRGFSDINPRVCGWENCDSGHSYGPATRDYYLLHYVRSGRGVYECCGVRHTVGMGQLFVIHPGEVTYYKADSHDPWQYAWVGFDAGIVLPRCLDQPVVEAASCGHIFASIASRIENGGELYLCGKIYELLAQLSAGEQPQGSIVERYVRRAQNYLESSYMQQITIDGLAGQLGLDRSYFCRIFTEQVGTPPSRYLLRLRLECAAELLSQRGCTVADAAVGCGYTDTVNFSRMFKRYFGVPPSRYK